MKKTSSIIIITILITAIGAGFFLMRQKGESSVIKPGADVTVGEGEESSPETLIIAFGDSLTAGYRLPLSESYPAQLEAKLVSEGFSVRVINAGVSGETTQGNRERAEFIRGQNPNIVILGIGGNDALRALPLSETKKNIQATIEALLSGMEPPKIILLKMQAPLNSGIAYKKEFDAIYEDIAEAYDIPLVPFLVLEVFLNSKYMLDDGIHPNKDGYNVLVEKYIWKEVAKLIGNSSK